jgi:long-chain fatty acid transport protein
LRFKGAPTLLKSSVLFVGTALALLASAGAVHASGFQLREQSATGQGTSFAGMSAGGEDISAMYFNPAALGRYRDSQVLGSAAYIAPKAKLKNGSASRSTGVAITGANAPNDAGTDAVVPAVYAMWDYGGPFKFGVSANVPYGLETDYGSDWIGRYHATNSAIRTLAIAPTASYDAGNGVTLGAAIVFQQIEAQLGKAANVNQISGGTLTGDAWSQLQGNDGHGVGGRFGVLWEITPATRVGAAYHTETRHTLKGDAKFSGNASAALGTLLRNSDITTNVALPDTASIGAQRDFGPFTLAAEAAWTRWSKVQELRIRFASGRADDVTPLKWRDTYFLALGAIYRVPSTAWTLRTGVAFDKSPVPEAERTPRIPDQDRTWLSLGASYRWNAALEFDAGYSHIFVENARLQMVDTGLASDVNRFRGNLSGEYESSIDILAVQARFKF